MTWIAGADGCKAGWVVVLRDVATNEMQIRLAPAIANALNWDEGIELLCADVPIGLLDAASPGGRECDVAARALLGSPRASSVFSPPVRPTLGAATYEEAVRRNRASSEHALGISRQCFAILGKIEEADRLINPGLQSRVLEVHPEVTFTAMNGDRPLAVSKKSVDGRRKRQTLLESAWHVQLSATIEAHRSGGVARDDILDAMAACWTAERVLRDTVVRLPARPPLDSRGLRMEIVR